MSQTRRDFIRWTAAAAGTAGLLGGSGCAEPPEPAEEAEPEAPPPEPSGPLRILVLGGTGFIGPHIVREALARGHEVTLFNRGVTNPELFADLEQLVGDRNDDLTALDGRRWDAAIDTAAMIPRWVSDVSTTLRGNVDQYLFVSTLSVHVDFTEIGITEESPVTTLGGTADGGQGSYGALKALAERAAEAGFPGQTTILRPGLIVGPGDPTDRFTYWPVRLHRGGDVVAPNRPEDNVLMIDVRDLAAFCIHCLEYRSTDVYSVVGPDYDLTMGQLIDAAASAVTSQHVVTWVPWDFLHEQDVVPWTDMPVWMPPTGPLSGFGHFNRDKAIGAGLTFRSLDETCRDTLQWFLADRDGTLRAGIAPDRQAAVLAAWRQRLG